MAPFTNDNRLMARVLYLWLCSPYYVPGILCTHLWFEPPGASLWRRLVLVLCPVTQAVSIPTLLLLFLLLFILLIHSTLDAFILVLRILSLLIQSLNTLDESTVQCLQLISHLKMGLHTEVHTDNKFPLTLKVIYLLLLCRIGVVWEWKPMLWIWQRCLKKVVQQNCLTSMWSHLTTST